MIEIIIVVAVIVGITLICAAALGYSFRLAFHSTK